MTEHKHGEMDITTQERTFAGFIRMVTWSCVIIIGILILLAIVGA
jgi:hypothetical protein